MPGPCLRCAHPFLESTRRFRVNSSGRRHDVWLVYRCPRCGERRKRELHRRARAQDVAPSLEAYRRDDPALALRHAFACAAPGTAVAWVVERPPLPTAAVLHARIVQPLGCGVRWDRLLARELGWPRARVQAAWEAGAVRIEAGRRLRHAVRDGDRLRVALDEPAVERVPNLDAATRRGPGRPRC
jgi:hypothetical protein